MSAVLKFDLEDETLTIRCTCRRRQSPILNFGAQRCSHAGRYSHRQPPVSLSKYFQTYLGFHRGWKFANVVLEPSIPETAVMFNIPSTGHAFLTWAILESFNFVRLTFYELLSSSQHLNNQVFELHSLVFESTCWPWPCKLSPPAV